MNRTKAINKYIGKIHTANNRMHRKTYHPTEEDHLEFDKNVTLAGYILEDDLKKYGDTDRQLERIKHAAFILFENGLMVK